MARRLRLAPDAPATPAALPRLRALKPALLRHARAVAEPLGGTATLDGGRLAQAVLAWSRGPGAGDAGELLGHLLAAAPLAIAVPGAGSAAAATPATFWPEGVALVRLCLALRPARPGPAMDDLRHWWSLRENAARDPSRAAAFLDAFAAPHARPPARPAARPALRLVRPAPRLHLPAGARLVLLDLGLLSTLAEVEAAALEAHLRAHGLAPEPGAAPDPAAAMRRLAQAGGRLCPHRFTAALEARIAARLAAELRPAAGAEAALAALRSAGIAARVVAAAPRARLEAALAHLPADWRALAGEIPAASPGVLIARDPRLAGTGRAAGLTVLAPEGGLDSIDWPA